MRFEDSIRWGAPQIDPLNGSNALQLRFITQRMRALASFISDRTTPRNYGAQFISDH
ncbi:hypothetical protein LIA77_00285 [Sarocladium implicatum]|nr:hypothetical protein LIA77_00285 [Sarocladium implicatum]